MKKKATSILLCITMVLAMMPSFTISAFAESQGENSQEELTVTGGGLSVSGAVQPVLAYVPLDNRPVNVDRVVYEAESAGFQVVMPEEDLYATRLDGQPLNANGTQFGDSQKLMDWLLEMDKTTDYFVISLDQLLSGGLVNSRTLTNANRAKEEKLMDAIVELSQNNHVYLLDTVTRLASCTVGYQGGTLETYNFLRQYNIKPRYLLKGSNLNIKNIEMDYRIGEDGRLITYASSNKKMIGNALRTRERKLNLIDYMLSADESGKIKYFIGIDDSSSSNTIQTNEINYIEQKMDSRGLIYSGTDELGMMAVLSLMIDYYGYHVDAATVYFGESESSSAGSVYDMETVRDNLEKHLDSIGVQVVETAVADLEIVVLTAPSQAVMDSKYISRMIDYVNQNIAKGTPTIVINSAPSTYGGDLEYRMIRECEMSMLLSYSSWGTVGNSIGLALGNGISRYLYLHSRDNSSDAADIAFLKGLIFSYEKDVSYLRGGGKTLFNNYLTSKGCSTSNFYQSDEQIKAVNLELEKILKTSEYNVTVSDIIDNLTDCRYFKGLGGACGIIGSIDLSNYSAPFFRTYEIRFDIDVELSDVTINGFQDAMSISMPYTPAAGELAYSVTLYYLDESGKLHKIPCIYDKATGSIQFASGLSGFFTDTLTMESDKAASLFTDVPESAWYFNSVLYVYEKGFMKGITANTFEPKTQMTRAMMAATLYNMAGSPKVDGQSELPQDVGNQWYSNAVVWALENEILSNCGTGTFGPDAPITREQLANALWQYANYSGMDLSSGEMPGVSNYADVFAVSEEFREGLDWACTKGIITGTDNGTKVSPQAVATRAEIAVVLKRFQENKK